MADSENMTAQKAKSSSGVENDLRWKIDYESFIREARRDPRQDVIAVLAEELPYAWRDAYLRMMPRATNIVSFSVRRFRIHV